MICHTISWITIYHHVFTKEDKYDAEKDKTWFCNDNTHICKFYSVSCINFLYIGIVSNIHNMLYIYYEFKEKQWSMMERISNIHGDML